MLHVVRITCNCLASLRANLTGLMAVWCTVCTKTTLITYTCNFTLEKIQVFQITKIYCCQIKIHGEAQTRSNFADEWHSCKTLCIRDLGFHYTQFRHIEK